MNIDLTFVGQIIVFVAMVLLLKRLLYAPINDAMEARTKKIEDGLAAASAGEEARLRAEEEAEKRIAEAKHQAQEIVAAAERRAAELQEESTLRARKDAAAIVDAGKAELEAEKNRARQELRAEVAAISMAAAEKILGVELDASRHSALIDEAISKELA